MKFKNNSLFIIFICLIKTSFSQSWIQQTSNTFQNLNSVYAVSSTVAYSVGAGGVARKTIDGGSNWNIMNLGVSTKQNSIRFINSTTGFTTGVFQDIMKTTNSGSSWSNIGGGITDLYDGFFTSATSGWVVGDIEVGYGFLYNPFTFSLYQNPVNANKVLYGIYFVNSSTGWVVGQGGLIIKTTNGGSTWNQQVSGVPTTLNKVMFLDSNNGIVVGNSGIILKTSNGGTSWQVIPSGSPIVNLYSIYYADALNAWIVGASGTILYSSNGGSSWSQENSGLPSDIYAVNGSDANHVWACGYGGKILYRDGSVSVAEPSIDNTSILVYPNPFGHHTSIISSIELQNAELKMYNLIGEEIISIKNISGKNVSLSKDELQGNHFVFYQLIQNNNFISSGKLFAE
jgi:photosystem II stability/assembly factor-like uncharacterized protein